MIFHYAGAYSGDENTLPQRNHSHNAVPFKEPDNMKKFSLVANIGGIITMILLAIPYFILAYEYYDTIWFFTGALCTVLTLFPHELLHAVFFKKDVYMYSNLKQGLLFVAGTEDMSKCRFILMSLCPNIIFGFIPYITFLIFPQLIGLGIFGLTCIGSGFGDYMNVFNAITQVPNGAKIYMSGIHSYWYKDEL